MNKELIEILKCISESSYNSKSDMCASLYQQGVSFCLWVNCQNCPVTGDAEYLTYKPYLIQL